MGQRPQKTRKLKAFGKSLNDESKIKRIDELCFYSYYYSNGNRLTLTL